MDPNIINGINEAYASIQEAYTVQGNARIGSTAAKATDKSVSSAVDKALANKGTAVSASSEKGKTGVTGGGSFQMSGAIGGGSNKPKPNPAPTGSSKPKPTPAAKPTSAPRVQNPAASPAPRVQNPAASAPTRRPGAAALGGGMSIARGGGGGGMMRMDTMSDVDTYNLVLEYLLDEGFASTEQSADKIILNMSEAWFEDIIEKRNPEVEEKGRKVAELEREGRAKGITDKFRKEHPGSREEKKERGRKPTEGELTQERIKKHNERVAKHGFTKKEKKESQAREKYDSARD